MLCSGHTGPRVRTQGRTHCGGLQIPGANMRLKAAHDPRSSVPALAMSELPSFSDRLKRV